MPLMTLAPEYNSEHHQVYLDLLERALRHPHTHSIALSGSYGSGKSSVLRALRRQRLRRGQLRRGRIVRLSMSTLDPKLATAVRAKNPAENEASNRIQKELVKQLLYQLPPRRTPHSRFSRASRPSWLPGAWIALLITALAAGFSWGLITLAGWLPAITDHLQAAGWTAPWFWGCAAVGFVILVLAIWRTVTGRYGLQAGFKAGAVTISLQPTASSYFDQYLDEIMYFFQVSKANVVLIEDVDRFSDAAVFDTLRSLNTLVNSSGQVGRRVVFVYAIRDSVLGQIGATTPGKADTVLSGDEASAVAAPPPEIDRANRAKYFDVIIPMVPFVTEVNARDMMKSEMAPHVGENANGEDVSPALIRIAARHVPDMRTILTIRNEFEVHLDRLKTSAPNVMPKINKDIILSLVLLRTTSPDAYEQIRLATSPLDKLVARWVELVDTNIRTQTENLIDLRTQYDTSQSRVSRAKSAGDRLESLRPALLPLAIEFAADKVEFIGPLTDGDLADPDGWQAIANGSLQTITLRARSTYLSVQVRLNRELLARLIGMPIDPSAWQEADLDDIRDKMQAAQEEIDFLRHHTWEQLCARTDLKVIAKRGEVKAKPPTADPSKLDTLASNDSTGMGESDSDDGRINFARLVQLDAPTELACGLITHGFLPREFARYASMFYGTVVSLNATEYIARAIEPGMPITEFELDDQDVRQILTEQNAGEDDAELFDDPSVYNLDIVGYLIQHRPGAAKRVAANLAERWKGLERQFVDRFFQRKDPDAAGALAAFMAPAWAQAIHYTAVDAKLPPDTRLSLVNAALCSISEGERDDLDAEVGEYLSANYSSLPAVIDPPNKSRSNVVMATIAAAGGIIQDLTDLLPTARAAATQFSIYPVTATNLRALGGAARVALDTLRDEPESRPIYDHMIKNLDDYLKATSLLNLPGAPINDPADFVGVLNDIAATEQQPAFLGRFVKATSAECRVGDLEDADPEAWQALISHSRTDPTFGNLQRYINEYHFDEAVGRFLAKAAAIETPDSTPQSERLALATAILRARNTIPDADTRVRLTASLAPGVIPIGQIAPEDANLVGPLLTAGMLADEAETFNPDLLTQWGNFEAAVAASHKFGEFADGVTMPTHLLAKTFRSKSIRSDTIAALIEKLSILLTGASDEDATAIAEALAERQEHLNLSCIEALASAGASDASLLPLISILGEEELPLADLRTILSVLHGDYARVSKGGRGKVRFEPDKYHKTLLERLDGITHTGATVQSARNGVLQLVANLKSSPR